MPAKAYKGPQIQRRVDGSEVFDNLGPRDIALAQTYPGYVERNKRALDGEHIEVQFYQAIRSGRRCSCWQSNTGQSKGCSVCYGEGVVGGFAKYGTYAWILDATASVSATNVEVYTVEQGPNTFGLAPDATYGELVAQGDLQGIAGPLDLIASDNWPGEDGEIRFQIRTPAHPQFVTLTNDSAADLLSTPQRFEIKIIMERPSVKAETPLFEKLMIRRFRTTPEAAVIKANRPRGTRAVALSDLGVYDDWTTENWWFDTTVSNITDRDWFLELERNIRWKAQGVDRFAPQNITLSWDVSVRKPQDFEKGIQTFPA